MPHYEISVDGQDLLIQCPAGDAKSLAFHATLLLNAPNREDAESQALSSVSADPHLAALSTQPPNLAIDAVAELPAPPPSLHGPIFCFFQQAE